MKYLITSIIAVSLFLFSCEEDAKPDEKIEKYVAKKAGDNVSKSEHISMATVWFQKSAENRALFYQTYNLAKMMLDKKIKGQKHEKPLAIITDIDETVLDNSPYNALLIEKNAVYDDDSWKVWVKEKRAKAMPGAIDFCKYAEMKKVEVFYVSNRNEEDKTETIANLKNEGFPFADKKHVLLKTESSDKTMRRQSVLETYEVILYLGDNLRDFDELFGGRGDDLGFQVVDNHSDDFGSKFIVFPNPIYGEWEKAVYDGDYSLSDEDKRSKRLDVLDK